MILGIDPSLTQFGWCLIEDDGFTVIERGRFKTKASDVFVERYIYLREQLSALIVKHKPDRVGIESPVFNDMYSEGMYALFVFCNEALMTNKMDTVYLTPPQVKSHAFDFLGRPKGWKMKKQDMVEASKKKSGTSNRWNHNEADAYWVAVVAHRFWQFHDGKLKVSELTNKEKHQFNRTHTFKRGSKQGQTEKTGIIHREDERFYKWST